MLLIYGCDTSGPIGYLAPLKAMTKVGPFSGSEDSFQGDNKGSISILGGGGKNEECSRVRAVLLS